MFHCGVDREVIYGGRLCASRCIYYTGDALLEVAGQVKCALAQLTFEKSREELRLHICVWIQSLDTHITATIPNIRDKNVLHVSGLESV